MTSGNGPTRKDFLLTLKLMWVALTASIFLYGLALMTVLRPERKKPLDAAIEFADTLLTDDSGLHALKYIAFAPAVGSLLVFMLLLSSEKMSERFRKQRADAALPGIFATYIVAWALNESVALFGFIYSYSVTKNPESYFPYLILALGLNILMFPRLEGSYRAARERESSAVSDIQA